MTLAHFRRWVGRLAVGVIGWTLAAAPAAAFCATCYAATAGSGSKIIRSLQVGILILLLPTLAIFVSLVVLAYRRRNSNPYTDPVRPEELGGQVGTIAPLLPYNKNCTPYHS
ncbi:MAG: hypothetical protein HY647_04735 [Acidobacteria bacterium]|nr:hypothetical protein [Acidobacteriota bacterium]